MIELCKQGSTSENAVLPKIRNRTLDLGEGTVKVLLLKGDDKPTAGLNEFAVTSSSGTITGVSDGNTSYEFQELPSFFSCLSELHVVARGRASKDGWTPISGHAVLVVVSSQATVLAVSDELITSNEKLFMTFDIEETNNVLQAKADFDGVITQGILEERLKKIDDDFNLGQAAHLDVVNQIDASKTSGNLVTDAAVVSYVGDGTLQINKGGTANVGTAEGAESFTANQHGNTVFNLGLGNAADKTVDNTITVTDVTDGGGTTVQTAGDNLPTSQAVNAFVGKGNLTITVGSDPSVVFNANAQDDANGNKSVTLGNAAKATTASSVSVTDATEQAKLPTNSAVDAFVGKGNLTITKGDGTSVVFNANAQNDVNGNKSVTFGTAADANVCTDIMATSGADSQGNNLVTLEQARQIADESTSNSKSLTPTAAGSNEDIVVEKGAMVWLAVHFVGEVGITDFTTSDAYLEGGAHPGETPTWSGTASSTGTDAYIAKLNDNAGDFYATTKKIAAGHTFRTLNAMDVSGMADPSYGFALCLCITSPSDSASNSQGSDATNNGGEGGTTGTEGGEGDERS